MRPGIRLAAAGIGVVISLMAAVGRTAADQTATFKAAVDLVRLDVSVTRGGQPVRGLTAADFSISDAGVPQRINSVTMLDELPVSVIMALDTSGSVAGEKLQHLIEAGKGVLAALRKDDRAALITFSERVRVPVTLTPALASIEPVLSKLSGAGPTAVRDAIWTALQLAPADETRPLVLVFSDGIDNASWLSASDLLEGVRRVGVVVHAVELVPAPSPRSPRSSSGPSYLNVLADRAGGRQWSATSSRELRQLFTTAIDEMRARYLVTFYPERTPRPGWHALKVGARGRGEVRARDGYFVPARE